MVYGYARIYTGTTGFNAGSGLYIMSIPLDAADELSLLADETAIGKAYFLDSSAAVSSTDMTLLYEPVNGVFTFRKQDGDYWRHNSPVAVGQGDKMLVYFCYPTKEV